jgi:hypothetical protein
MATKSAAPRTRPSARPCTVTTSPHEAAGPGRTHCFTNEDDPVSDEAKSEPSKTELRKKEIRIIEKKETAEETKRPQNLRADILPSDGYGLEVDGKIKTQFVAEDAAMKAGLELKKKFPLIQVKIFDAKQRTRTQIELPKD